MIEEGKKVCNDHESLIDYVLVEVAKPVSDPLHKLGVTPNMITIMGLIFGLFSIHFLIKKQYILSFVFLWITYWSDCLDGFFARKYNQVTKLGDYLDHFRDMFVSGSITILVLMQLNGVMAKVSAGIIIAIFAVMMCYYIGCQESVTDYNEHNDCLDFFRHMCGDHPEEEIKYTRHFGCGTFIMVLSIFILVLKIQERKLINV